MSRTVETERRAYAAFADLLRQHRLAAGLTQEELAERAGLSARGISDLERGARRHPHRETVRLLADALGLSGAARATFAPAAPRSIGRPIPRPERVVAHLPVPLTPLIGRHQERGGTHRPPAGGGSPAGHPDRTRWRGQDPSRRCRSPPTCWRTSRMASGSSI